MKKVCLGSYGVSSILVLSLLIFTYNFCSIGFETNDDTGMLMFVTGAKTGTPTAATIFANILWGGILSSLYRLIPYVPWYIIIYLSLLWMAMTIVCRCCMEFFKYSPLDRPDRHIAHTYIWGGGLFITLYCSLFFFSSVLFQFTTIAAICGLGAILLMKMHPDGEFRVYLAVALLLFFSDVIRPKVGCMATFAFMLMFFFIWMVKEKYPKKFFLVLAIVLQGSVQVVNFLYEKWNNWELFRKYHSVRAAWKDYPHPEYLQGDYGQIGWSKELYDCAEKWFFMDRRINTEAFEAVREEQHFSLSISALTQEISDACWNIYLATAQFRVVLVLLILCILFVAAYSLWKKQYRQLVGLIVLVCPAIAILLYFSMAGRMPYRVAFSVVILFMLPMIFFLSDLFGGYIQWAGMKIKCIMAVILVGISFISFRPYGMVAITYAQANKEHSGIEIKRRVEEYAMANPSNIYIYDYSLTLSGSPFQVYPRRKPYNLTFWGGSGMYSPPYYDQLKANGLNELYSDQFFADNIYFLGKEEPSGVLVKYMESEFPGCWVELVERQEGFIVYRFCI